MELSGLVAILNDQGRVVDLRYLGPDPVPVREGRIVPVEDQKPEGESAPPPLSAIEIVDGVAIRVWVPVAPVVPHRVTARQFRLQLRAAGLHEAVIAWVGQQDGYVQDAFEYSGTFVKDDPMMQAGFAALGATTDQIDEFFLAAADL